MTTKVQIIDDGVTGFVMLKDDIAIKHMDAIDLYWPAELAIHYYLKPFITDNIVKLIDVEMDEMEPECETNYLEEFPINLFVKLKFARHRHINEITLKRPGNLIQFLLDITSGLSLLHRHNIIHRDLKIKNILYDGKKYIIIDFSNSYKIFPCCSNYRDEVTTITHEAPEITKARKNKDKKIIYTTAIDMWSLGIIILDLLSEGKATTETYNYKTQEHVENFIISLADSKNVLNRYIWRNTGSVEATHAVFIKWVRMLLNKDPKRRITAQALYNLVKQYAEENNIEHRVPLNTECDIIDMLNSDIPQPRKVVSEKFMQHFRKLGKTENQNIFNSLPKLNLEYPTITELYLCALRDVLFNVVYDRNIYFDDDEDDDRKKELVKIMFDIVKNQIDDIFRSCALPKDIKFTDRVLHFLEF